MPSPSTMAESDCNAESEYDGRVRLQCRVRVRWPSPTAMPSPSTMSESDCNAESEWCGRVTFDRIRVMCPNHPGRVRLAVRNILAESDWLAE